MSVSQLFTFMFNVLGTNRQNTTYKKHSMICQVDTMDYLNNHSLRKSPHAFGSELVNKSETEKAC